MQIPAINAVNYAAQKTNNVQSMTNSDMQKNDNLKTDIFQKTNVNNATSFGGSAATIIVEGKRIALKKVTGLEKLLPIGIKDSNGGRWKVVSDDVTPEQMEKIKEWSRNDMFNPVESFAY